MDQAREKLLERVKQLPDKPGVYLFKNSKGRVIYIGKAKSLIHRVRSYFYDVTGGPLTYWMVADATDLDFIVTDSPAEALMLENNLIKKNQPRYNILLRDDKTHPYIKLTVQEDFPRAYIVRRVRKDGAAYFGPFIPASLAKKTLNLIYRYFLLRQCHIKITEEPQRLCLLYHIHRCLGPCAQLATREEYARAVTDVRMFLEGKKEDLLARLREKMFEYSSRQQYELAANYRDLANTVEELNTRPKLISYELEDADLFGYARSAENIAVQIFFMRNGQIVGRHEFFFESKLVTDSGSLLSHVLMQFYSMPRFLPKNIYVQHNFPDREVIEQLLAEKKGSKVKVNVPVRGKKKKLLQLVIKNAQIALEVNSSAGRVRSYDTLQALQETINMSTLPYRIEAFDISNIQGTNSVASMVVWEAGRPKKGDYRKFKIRGVVGPDDFRSIAEVVERRVKRVLDKEWPMPDLMIIDGGKGQLNAALDVLQKYDLNDQPIMGLAKREEEIFLPGHSDSIKLEERSPVLKLIQQVRNEAHRFAITFHRQLRTKRSMELAMDEIRGIGPKRKQILLQHFGSLEKVRMASKEELQKKLGPVHGDRLYSKLHPELTTDEHR
ncbi:excinuclease ABC subunit UvrC [bacterium]|nr:excinuclease ABC subunit UvrC [bacterium]